MASIVESVEYVALTWDNTANGATNLTKGQDETQCVPFWSWQLSAASLPDEWNERCHAIDIYNNAGTAAVRVIRGGEIADTDDRVSGVFVVEFAAGINVQKVAFTLADASTSTNVTITDVGSQSSAFAILTHDFDDAASNYDQPQRACIEMDWNGASTTSLTLTRNNSGGDIDGWIYVVDCDSGEFTVEWATITGGTDFTSATNTITTVVDADTFLIPTYQCSEGGDDPRDGSVVVDLQNTTTIRARRGTGSGALGTADITVQVVECQNGEWSVQRGDITMTTTPETATITAVTQANSAIISGCHVSSVYDLGTSNLLAGNQVADCSCLLTFNSSTEINSARDADDETGNTVPWQVVDFTGTTTGIPIFMYHYQNH